MIIKHLTVGSIGTNCYLLEDEAAGLCAAVDPGGSAQEILSALAADGVSLSMILLTHGHFDHTGAVAALREAYPGVKVYLHPADRAMLGNPVMPAIGETVDYGEGDTLSFGPLTLRVLHTPGHTPGGVCLDTGEVLFTGDTLFQGSMGRTDLGGGSYEELMASLKKLGSLPGDRQVCPGHMGLTTLEAERRSNYYLMEAMAP